MGVSPGWGCVSHILTLGRRAPAAGSKLFVTAITAAENPDMARYGRGKSVNVAGLKRPRQGRIFLDFA
jgi:hypothetical protein